MNPTFDVLVGLLFIHMAVCGAFVLVFSSRHRRKWMNIPEYVRVTIRAMVVMMVWRGVNFISLANADSVVAGRASAETLLATITTACFFTAMAFWMGTSVLPDKAWERLEWVKRMLRGDPTKAPIMVHPSEVVEVAHASGLQAVGPGEPPEAVIRELERRAPRARVSA